MPGTFDDPAAVAASLRALTEVLDGTDGVVPGDVAQPAIEGWTHGPVVPAAHPDLPRHPQAITAVLGQVTALTAGLAAGDWAVLLLASPPAGPGCWDALLAAAAVTDAQPVSLAQPGINPGSADLTGMRAATHYVVDLADDGTGDLPGCAARLARVIDQVRTVKPAARVLLVGHSYPVLGAAQYVSDLSAADRAARVLGLIALAAPWSPVDVPGFADATEADGLRMIRRLFPDGLPGTVAVDRAVDHLAAGLEATAAAQHGVPTATPYPVQGFRREPGPANLGQTPVLTVGGDLGPSLPVAVAAGLAGEIAPAGAPAGLGGGVRVELPLPAPAAGEPDVRVTVRLDLGEVPLAAAAAAAPAGPITRLAVDVWLSRPGDWLIGDALTTGGTRLRAARFGAAVDASGAAAYAWFDDCSAGGLSAPAADLTSPLGQPMAAAVVSVLDAAARSAPPAGAAPCWSWWRTCDWCGATAPRPPWTPTP